MYKIKKQNKKIRIAIDGFSAAGKTTVAKIIAKKLHYIYVNTGLMYRIVSWFCLKNKIDYNDQKKFKLIINKIKDKFFKNNNIFNKNYYLNKKLNSINVSEIVSDVATKKWVRTFLSNIQKKIAKKKSVVMDGRDIGTYIIPDAEIKIFLTAEPKIRAFRRFNENKNVSFLSIMNNIKKRDFIDLNRQLSPLKKADDAIEINTTKLTINEVVNKILEIIKEKCLIKSQ